MATGAVPVRIRTAISLFVENSHLETRHQGVMFRSQRAFVGSTATLRYEPCTQFINVSQRTLHIYFIDGCRRIKIERNNLLCEQAPTEVFRSIFAWLVTFNLVLKAMDGGRDASTAVDESITGEGVHRHDGRVA